MNRREREREAGGREGGRGEESGGECVAATADSKLEAREEVRGNIFNVTSMRGRKFLRG